MIALTRRQRTHQRDRDPDRFHHRKASGVGSHSVPRARIHRVNLFRNPSSGAVGEMWSLRNHTPYAAGRAWGRDKDGVHEWIVAVKGTYNINSDGLSRSPINSLNRCLHRSTTARISCRAYDTTLTSSGPTTATDVLVNGTAYAPGVARPPSFRFPFVSVA